jgi:uncharacterized protein (DUF1697 family)
MQTWVCLLIAVNLGARNKVPMARLRSVLTAVGFSDVSTYLQSGNVILRSALSAVEVSSLVHGVVTDEFGVDSTVIVRDRAQLQQVVAGNPFADQVDTRPHLVGVIFLAGRPAAEQVAALSDDASLAQVSRVDGEHVYVDYVDGVHGNSRTASFFERALRVQGTERNWRTVLALHKMTLTEGSCL